MRLLELLGLSGSDENAVETIQLNGPFVDEGCLLKQKDKYRDLLKETFFKCNLIISRDVLVLSPDRELVSRDDARVELGITHHIHQLELFFKNYSEFEIVGIDNFIILNPEDALTVKNYIINHPLTDSELKGIHLIS